ncbi:MAG: zinc ABC transporter substrate-binding protein, partial [Planctomycetota bacterium]
MPKQFLLQFCAVVVLFCFTGCYPDPPEIKEVSNQVSSAQVYAVCYPLQFAAQQLVGDELNVQFIGPPAGESAVDWRPNRADILAMQAADMIVTNGIGAQYADWLLTVSIPESKLCDTASRALKLRDFIQVDDVEIVHTHGPEGEHSHPLTVSHTWLDPAMFQKQVNYLADQLKIQYPDQNDSIETSRKTLTDQLDVLVDKTEKLKKSLAGAKVITASPKLKFLTRSLGLDDLHLNLKSSDPVDDQVDQVKKFWSGLDPKVRPKWILFPGFSPDTQLETFLNELGLGVAVLDTVESQI